MIENGLSDVGRIIFRNATRMALEHVTPEGCAKCTSAICARGYLIELAVRNNYSVRESVDKYNEQIGSCEGMKPTGEVRDCMPKMRCGNLLGPAAVGTLWREELSSSSNDPKTEVK